MSPLILNELRLLSSACFDSQSLLCIVLSGDARLLDKLRREELIPLGSRIRTRLATELASREDLTDMARFSFYAPAELARFIAPKGSVALDGVSLTVNDVTDDTFSVLIIPHTLKVTTLGALAAGDHVNLEVDLMARYAARLMARP